MLLGKVHGYWILWRFAITKQAMLVARRIIITAAKRTIPHWRRARTHCEEFLKLNGFLVAEIDEELRESTYGSFGSDSILVVLQRDRHESHGPPVEGNYK